MFLSKQKMYLMFDEFTMEILAQLPLGVIKLAILDKLTALAFKLRLF